MVYTGGTSRTRQPRIVLVSREWWEVGEVHLGCFGLVVRDLFGNQASVGKPEWYYLGFPGA